MKKTASTVIGIVLLVTGAGMAYWGYQQSGSIGSQISQTLTGSHNDKIMMLYIGGAASFVVGLYLFFKR
jgi:hypothetical protein